MAQLSEGSNTFKITTKSGAGLWGSVGSFEVKVDTVDPAIGAGRIDGGTDTDDVIKTSHTSIRIVVTSIDGGISGVKTTTFSWSNDGNVYFGDVSYDGSQLEHTFEDIDVRADYIYGKIVVEDNAGNTNSLIITKQVLYKGHVDYGAKMDRWSLE